MRQFAVVRSAIRPVIISKDTIHCSGGCRRATSATLRRLQADQFASHQHALTDPGHFHLTPTTNGVAGQREVPANIAAGFDYLDASGNSSPVSTSMTGIDDALAGGGETRPKNVAVNYIIKT